MHKSEYCLEVIGLLQIGHMYVVVLEEGLSMGLVELFLGGPGFASTSPEARSRAANHSVILYFIEAIMYAICIERDAVLNAGASP